MKSNFKEIDPQSKINPNGDSPVYSITSTLVSEIVKEQDEFTIQQIENYVKNKQSQGELISSNIIGEGRLRHIINLGLSLYANREHMPISSDDLFPQENYIEYLNRRLDEAEKTIRELQSLDREELVPPKKYFKNSMMTYSKGLQTGYQEGLEMQKTIFNQKITQRITELEEVKNSFKQSLNEILDETPDSEEEKKFWSEEIQDIIKQQKFLKELKDWVSKDA